MKMLKYSDQQINELNALAKKGLVMFKYPDCKEMIKLKVIKYLTKGGKEDVDYCWDLENDGWYVYSQDWEGAIDMYFLNECKFFILTPFIS